MKGGRIGRVTGLLSSLLNIRVVMEMKNDELQPIVKGRGQKTFKKWLDELIQDLSGKEIAEIGISYAGGPDFANQMTGSIIQTHTGEDAWAVLVRFA